MKALIGIIFIALLVSSNGCMTYSTVHKAKGEYNRFTGGEPQSPQPGYYALLPVAVIGDIVTSPVQLMSIGFLYVCVWATGDGP